MNIMNFFEIFEILNFWEILNCNVQMIVQHTIYNFFYARTHIVHECTKRDICIVIEHHT